ncbi:DNA-binding transcriptional regulator SoxS [Kordia sp. SMS9]|uniref:helix-turn-helix domain-containing protein n=1 Tax=Kordia sp. SMS9 TaxID=2282170 RepID=UPI000E0D43B2|nr:helix-turn-helix domain-containing protein [Kordia sp. SMS9]AXG68595.1 DNA-binding transcriptional regulator SoxS [Kordia sp. SMS9]
MYTKCKFISIVSFLLSTLLLLSSLSLNAQTDSLQGKSYNELEQLYKIERHNNPKLAKVYAEIIYQRSKQENNPKRIAQSLYKKATLSYNLGIYDSATYYSNTSLKIGKQLANDSLILQNYCLKGNIASIGGDYKTAIDNYLIAKNVADEMGNINDVLQISHNIGFLKKQTKDLTEAAAIFKKNLRTIREHNLNELSRLEVASLAFLSETYLRMKDYNTAKTYTEEGLLLATKNKYKELYLYLNANKTIIQFQQQQYQKSIASSKASITSILDFGNEQSLTTPYLYIGKSYLKLKKYDSAIFYFKKFENIVQTKEIDTPELEEVYEFLALCYASTGDKQNSILYFKKFAELDKQNDSINTNMNNDLHEKYDILPLKQEINSLDTTNQKQKKRETYLYISLIILVISLLAFFIWFKRKQRQNKLRFQKLLVKIETLEKPKEKIISKKIISKETHNPITDENVLQILKALEAFEEKELYLRLDCTLGYVAKKLKTNTSYLSNVINTYKEKPFRTYLSELRINAALIKLKNDEKLRSYTIKAIAAEFGYKRSETFSRVFKAHTEMYPSAYIKSLENQKNK